jgi:hypothetical protein
MILSLIRNSEHLRLTATVRIGVISPMRDSLKGG